MKLLDYCNSLCDPNTTVTNMFTGEIQDVSYEFGKDAIKVLEVRLHD
jgi:hypothetical protein